MKHPCVLGITAIIVKSTFQRVCEPREGDTRKGVKSVMSDLDSLGVFNENEKQI